MKVAITKSGRVHRIIGMTSGDNSYVVNNNYGTYELLVEFVIKTAEVKEWVDEPTVRLALAEEFPEYFI